VRVLTKGGTSTKGGGGSRGERYFIHFLKTDWAPWLEKGEGKLVKRPFKRRGARTRWEGESSHQERGVPSYASREVGKPGEKAKKNPWKRGGGKPRNVRVEGGASS